MDQLNPVIQNLQKQNLDQTKIIIAKQNSEVVSVLEDILATLKSQYNLDRQKFEQETLVPTDVEFSTQEQSVQLEHENSLLEKNNEILKDILEAVKENDQGAIQSAIEGLGLVKAAEGLTSISSTLLKAIGPLGSAIAGLSAVVAGFKLGEKLNQIPEVATVTDKVGKGIADSWNWATGGDQVVQSTAHKIMSRKELEQNYKLDTSPDRPMSQEEFERERISKSVGGEAVRAGRTRPQAPLTQEQFEKSRISKAPEGLGQATAKYQPGESAEGLGETVAKYESGSKGTAAVGWDERGGTSYGKYQIASSTGTFSKFLEKLEKTDPEAAKQLKESGPANTGSSRGEAVTTWKKLASEGRLQKAEHEFIKETHYDPAIKEAAKLGYDVNDPRVQEMVWSGSIQHGGIKKILKSAAGGKDAEEQVKRFYEARTEYAKKNTSQKDLPGVLNRYKKEKEDVLAMDSSKKSETQVASSETAKKIPEKSEETVSSAEKIIPENNIEEESEMEETSENVIKEEKKKEGLELHGLEALDAAYKEQIGKSTAKKEGPELHGLEALDAAYKEQLNSEKNIEQKQTDSYQIKSEEINPVSESSQINQNYSYQQPQTNYSNTNFFENVLGNVSGMFGQAAGQSLGSSLGMGSMGANLGGMLGYGGAGSISNVAMMAGQSLGSNLSSSLGGQLGGMGSSVSGFGTQLSMGQIPSGIGSNLTGMLGQVAGQSLGSSLGMGSVGANLGGMLGYGGTSMMPNVGMMAGQSLGSNLSSGLGSQLGGMGSSVSGFGTALSTGLGGMIGSAVSGIGNMFTGSPNVPNAVPIAAPIFTQDQINRDLTPQEIPAKSFVSEEANSGVGGGLGNLTESLSQGSSQGFMVNSPGESSGPVSPNLSQGAGSSSSMQQGSGPTKGFKSGDQRAGSSSGAMGIQIGVRNEEPVLLKAQYSAVRIV